MLVSATGETRGIVCSDDFSSTLKDLEVLSLSQLGGAALAW